MRWRWIGAQRRVQARQLLTKRIKHRRHEMKANMNGLRIVVRVEVRRGPHHEMRDQMQVRAGGLDTLDFVDNSASCRPVGRSTRHRAAPVWCGFAACPPHPTSGAWPPIKQEHKCHRPLL